MRDNRKAVSILGSTGSIGMQTLDVIREKSEEYYIRAISCNSDIDKLASQVEEFKPQVAVVYDEAAYKRAKELISDRTTLLCGMEGLLQISSDPDCDTLVTSVVGNIGLRPTLEAVKLGKRIALANKETLVTSGSIIMKMARESGAEIIPVDSEHSAIFQALQGNRHKDVEKIILTASGGPFRGRRREELSNVTAQMALKHPKWDMGKKISIDSSTLMNKGLEVIEAKWLFDLEADQVDVVVHPQSIIHSMVQYVDSSIIAQMGLPDMRLPIAYALAYPLRERTNLERLDFSMVSELTFEKPDNEAFPCLSLAYEALRRGGIVPTVMNAANEIAVDLFLRGRIGFYDIPSMIEKAMSDFGYISAPSLEDILSIDGEVRHKLLKEN